MFWILYKLIAEEKNHINSNVARCMTVCHTKKRVKLGILLGSLLDSLESSMYFIYTTRRVLGIIHIWEISR